MNLFIFELKSNLKYTIIWALAVSITAVGFLLMFPSFSNDIDTAKSVIEKLPLGIRRAMNVNLDTFFSLAGFYSYILNFILLASSIMSLNLSLKLFSEESSLKTADFLLTKPISRPKIFLPKFMSGISLLVIYNLIYWLMVLFTTSILNNNENNILVFVLINFSLLLVQLLFFALGSLIGSAKSRLKTTISTAMPVVFAFFVFAALDSAISSIKLSEFSPFSFFNRNFIIENLSLETKYLVISTVLFTVLTFLGLTLFNKKDMKF